MIKRPGAVDHIVKLPGIDWDRPWPGFRKLQGCRKTLSKLAVTSRHHS